jgi:hypothetical protein
MQDLPFDALRGEPRPEFAESVRARLRAMDTEAAPVHRWPIRPVASSAAAVAVAALAFTVPAVRASAASFLSLFRVTNLVVVPVNAGRLDALNASQLSPAELIGNNVQII